MLVRRFAECHACVSSTAFVICYTPRRAAAQPWSDGSAASARFSTVASAVAALDVNLFFVCVSVCSREPLGLQRLQEQTGAEGPAGGQEAAGGGG